MPLQVGSRIADRYTVRRSIGSGGMGGVFEIEGDALKNRLALKLIRSDLMNQELVRKRFQREARIQSTLSHPGIARVFDLLEHDGHVGIVMELVDAPTLRDRLRGGALDPKTAREVMFELVSALMAAHEAGIVHRDLKPENIFVQTDAMGTSRCKLIDFGIAKPLKPDARGSARERLTKTLAFVGTYTYASPEQVRRGTVDPRTDLYSAGVVLWEMLAGVSPYADIQGAYEIQSAVVNRDLPDLPADVPHDLTRLVVELTRKDPDERPQSAQEVLASLRQPSAQGWEASTSRSPGLADTAIPGVEPTAPSPSWAPSSIREPLSAASGWRRFKARVRDEALPMVLVILLFGIVLYPFFAIFRGMRAAGSEGQQANDLMVCGRDRRTRAGRLRVLWRNTLDLLLFGVPMAVLLFMPSWVLIVPAMIAAAWLALVLTLDAALVMTDAEGRRVVDRLSGTRVCVVQ